MSEPLLKIRNHHSPTCGDPPIVNGDDPALYIGYFENPFGEQWIFTYDRKTKKGLLRGGDAGWNTALDVEGDTPAVVLGPEESQWLKACWRAASGGK